MDRRDRADKIKDSRLNLLLAARLLSRFSEGCPEDELYQRAIRCYDVLLEIKYSSLANQRQETIREISNILKMPSQKIVDLTGDIIDSLLFNRGDDPLISLGLPRDGYKDLMNKRWKKLLTIYHPDRFLNQIEYEERAKKINEAYKSISDFHPAEDAMSGDNGGIGGKGMFTPVINNVGVKYAFSSLNLRKMKNLPIYILITVMFIAIFYIILFINRL